jgi:RHS repeat-associated protein
VNWRWDHADPFGASAVDESFSQNGASPPVQRLRSNLRFPGQYYDVETGLHYNYFRDYDPQTGRYIQSDSVGLEGGINTYAYALNRPTSLTDPDGLNPGIGCLAGAWAGPVGCGVGAGIGTAIMGGVALAAIMSTSGDTSKTDSCSPGDKDPCKGLRDQLRDHERKLREYMANPMAADNKGFLAGALTKNDQELYTKIYLGRIASLQGQIANFKKQLEECERTHGH